jgi:dTDP-4-dehydrorhamnose reductase
MLGQAVCEAVQRDGHILHSNGVDITNVHPTQITGEVVINCAGIVKQRTEIAASEFIRVNAYGPHRLAECCDEARARLIHVSTDCVFNDYRGPHSESDSPTPIDTYSYSKLAGEVIRWPHLTIRTSFIGWGRQGLLSELYEKQGQTIECYGQRWSGHTVETVADTLIQLAQRSDVRGLLHIPGEFQSRFQLMMRLIRRFNLDVAVSQSRELPGYDRRLMSERWGGLGLSVLPNFETQLERMQEL